MRARQGSASFIVGAAILAVLTILAIISPVLWGTASMDSSGPLRAPSSPEHLLGTDAQGRDVFARTLVATRLSLLMALAATAISVVLGGLFGLAAALGGAAANWWGGRFIDLMISWPPIVIALAVTAILRPSPWSLVLAIGLAASPQFARMSYSLARTESRRDYAVTATMIGVSKWRLLMRHVLPGVASPLLVLGSAIFASALLAMSGLSFIGLGIQAPQFDWGTLLSAGLSSLYSNPVEILGPSVMIVLTGVAAGLLGDGLARMNDPRQRRSRRAGAPEVSTAGTPPESPVGAEAGRETHADDVVLRARGLRVGIAGDPARELVHGIDFDVRRGEILGIVGESGSGKSLTAMTSVALTPHGIQRSADELTCAGIDLLDPAAPLRTLALRVGVVFQDPSSTFNPAKRLGAQITEPLRVHRGLSKRRANELAIAKLAEVRISQPELRIRQYPHELSGGMRQRAMIAMSLLTEPDLIVADEPTTALDVTVQAEVLRLIRQINQQRGTSVLLVSHDISVISAMCDRVLVMRDGVIVEEMSSSTLRAGEAKHPYTRELLASSVRARLEQQAEESL